MTLYLRALCLVALLFPAVALGADAGGAVHAVLINGGGKATSNYTSHVHHVQDLVAELENRGIPASRITVFSADGSDPGKDQATRDVAPGGSFWLVKGTPLGRTLKPQTHLIDTVLDGVDLLPATNDAVRRWFKDDAKTLIKDGDTVLLFVTDHGTGDKRDPRSSFISMWNDELSVMELRGMLDYLNPNARVVMWMSQCHSGGFAQAMYRLGDDLPGGDVCGYFSTTSDRLAYGCYPEGRGKDKIGHAFRFIDALARTDTLPAAHREVGLMDRTPDVPIRTSDIFLEDQLTRVAAARGIELNALIDELLSDALTNRGRWEPQIRHLDAIGQVYGMVSPRRMEELAAKIEQLDSLSKAVKKYKDTWKRTFDALRVENVTAFGESNSKWVKKLGKDKDERKTKLADLKKLEDDERAKMLRDLLPDLEAYTALQPEVSRRLALLRDKSEQSQGAWYRIDVRRAAAYRMRSVLIDIAGRELLESRVRSEDATAYDLDALDALRRLEHCEQHQPGELPAPMLAAADIGEKMRDDAIEPYPAFEEDKALVQGVVPSWMGIRFKPVSESIQEKYEVSRGSVLVNSVYLGSSAEKAGIQAGDILVGPPDRPFEEPYQVREWTMTSPQNEPLDLLVIRDEVRTPIVIHLEPFPVEWPELPAPPEIGEAAPDPGDVMDLGGKTIEFADSGYVLFFWATWCGPCKKAIPELMAFAEEKGVQIVAVSDEDASVQSEFFETWEDPFPATRASNPLRSLFLKYSVSGTPHFAWVDGEGTLKHLKTGYSPAKGLEIEGWTWNQ